MNQYIKSVISAIVAIIGKCFKPKTPKFDHLTIAPVFKRTLPSEIPTPNTIIVPHGILFSTCFHVMTPISALT